MKNADPQTGTSYKIQLVEDDPRDAELTTMALKADHPSNISGLEVLKIVRADKRFKTLSVVVLSSTREMKGLFECYEHGANAHVVKPLDFSKFAKAVRQIGIFWATFNEPPPAILRKETDINQDGFPSSSFHS